MTKRVVYTILVAVMLGFGQWELVPLNKWMFTQNSVCDSEFEYSQYSVMQYVEERKIIIPALEQKFIPQGIAFWDEKNWFIISGYFRPDDIVSGAALLAVDAHTGKFAGIYTLSDAHGRSIDGHFSGVAITENDLYVSHGSELLQVPLCELDDAGMMGILNVEKRHETWVDDAGCNFSDGILWVCEHYRNMENGAHNKFGTGRMIGYRVNDLGSLIPYCVILVPDKVQGVTVTENGQLIFSISYGRTNPSRILVYSDPRENTPDGYATIDDTKVPLWDLARETAVLVLTAPPMSEGCCTVEKRVYLIFESAAYYYRAFRPDHRSVDPTDRIWEIMLVNEK